MKHLIIATTLVLGLSCIASVSAAQDESQTTSLNRVTVNAVPGQYEIYAVNLNAGYGLQVLVGHTHRQYVQAQRAAERFEAMRKQGMALSPFVSVAIDNSSGPGSASRFLVFDPTQTTVAAVNVYCKHAISRQGNRCQLDSRDASDQNLASTATPSLRLAEVDQR